MITGAIRYDELRDGDVRRNVPVCEVKPNKKVLHHFSNDRVDF